MKIQTPLGFSTLIYSSSMVIAIYSSLANIVISPFASLLLRSYVNFRRFYAPIIE
jgi:hypothetical protein